MQQQRRQSEEFKKSIKPDIETASKAIEKNIGEKAFAQEKIKERDTQKMEIKPDIEGIAKKIEKDIEKHETEKKDHTDKN